VRLEEEEAGRRMGGGIGEKEGGRLEEAKARKVIGFSCVAGGRQSHPMLSLHKWSQSGGYTVGL
jgi:hypothetical protein